MVTFQQLPVAGTYCYRKNMAAFLMKDVQKKTILKGHFSASYWPTSFKRDFPLSITFPGKYIQEHGKQYKATMTFSLTCMAMVFYSFSYYKHTAIPAVVRCSRLNKTHCCTRTSTASAQVSGNYITKK